MHGPPHETICILHHTHLPLIHSSSNLLTYMKPHECTLSSTPSHPFSKLTNHTYHPYPFLLRTTFLTFSNPLPIFHASSHLISYPPPMHIIILTYSTLLFSLYTTPCTYFFFNAVKPTFSTLCPRRAHFLLMPTVAAISFHHISTFHA